jgi:D-serine deaminase-like pyridoxal phosphate-dependent protein
MYNPDHMNWFDPITSPTLVLDKERCLSNIHRLAARAKASEVRFRPHYKTHQSAVIGEWFRPLGVDAITVSSVAMAKYFADHGWNDITIAFPVNLREIQNINDLAKRIHLELLVESLESIRFLAENLKAPVGLWLKADVGAHRSGIPVEEHETFLALAKEAKQSKRLALLGVLTHAGQTYHAGSVEEVKQIYRDEVGHLISLNESLQKSGFMDMQISWGDTPSCSLVDDLSRVDEIRPGNFVLYDYTQFQIGSCREEDIAAAVACPVVALHPERNEVVIHGGAIHLSKERLEHEGGCSFGAVALPTVTGWSKYIPGAYVKPLSQEHGIVSIPEVYLSQIHIGDLLVILPVHSCLAVDLFKQYHSLDGEIIPTMRMEPA